MRKSILATALAGILVWAGVAGAAPLGPPGLSLATDSITGDFTSIFATSCGGFSCIAGEGAAPNDNIGMGAPAGAVIHVDWIVVHDGNVNGGYTYYYQVENSSIATVTDLLIFSEFFQAAGIVSGEGGNPGGFDAGTMAGTPIGAPLAGTAPLSFGAATTYALPGHVDANFDNLGVTGVPGVDDTADGLPVCPACPADIEIIPPSLGELNPGFGAAGNLFVGDASGISIAQGVAPVYVHYQLQGTMANQWGSVNGNALGGEVGRQIPGPGVPEPGTILLLGSGLAGLAIWARRRQG